MAKKRKGSTKNTKKPKNKKKETYVEPDDFSTLRDVPIYWEPLKKKPKKRLQISVNEVRVFL